MEPALSYKERLAAERKVCLVLSASSCARASVSLTRAPTSQAEYNDFLRRQQASGRFRGRRGEEGGDTQKATRFEPAQGATRPPAAPGWGSDVATHQARAVHVYSLAATGECACTGVVVDNHINWASVA